MPLKVRERTAVEKLAYKLARFRTGPTSFFSDDPPYCDEPVTVVRYQRPSETTRGVEAGLLAPCRKCLKCRQFRQMLWRERMIAEMQHSSALGMRTWFGTFTFSPPHFAGVLAEAEKFARGTETERTERAAYAHVQKYWKRLRKSAPHSKFRMVTIFELGGTTGREHFHCLIHEQGPRPLVKRHLEENWRSFTTWRVTYGNSTGAASYVAKYLTKQHSRPRASLSYGSPPDIGPQRPFKA